MLLQQDGVTEFTWFDLYIKLVAIRPYIKTKLPSIWQDDAKPWKSQKSIEKSRIQDIKIHMNRGGWRCADFVDNFKFYGKRGKTPLFEISDKNRDISTDAWIEAANLVRLPKVIYLIVDGKQIPTSKEDFIESLM